MLIAPWTSSLLSTLKLVRLSPFWLESSLKTRLDRAPVGKPKLPIPVRVVAVSWVLTPLPSATL